MYLQSPLSGEKKCKHFSSSEKKEHLVEGHHQGRPSRAPVNVGSTLGQPWVTSLAISGRFLLILQVSSIKTEDKETCICKMVDFPIRKREFRVCGWSGAFWEPQERKKEKTKCIYRRVEKKPAAERRFFIKKETLLLEGTALSRGMWKPCIDDMWVCTRTAE